MGMKLGLIEMGPTRARERWTMSNLWKRNGRN